MSSRLLTAAAALVMLFSAASAPACPFCANPSVTLTEQISQSAVTVLVQWHGGTQGNTQTGQLGTTLYKVLNVVRDDTGKLSAGTTIAIDRYRTGKEGNLTLLMGDDYDGRIEWQSTLDVTEASFQYIMQAPSRELPMPIRLAYFVRFLEYPDEMIAADAYGEFTCASYDDVAKIGEKIPREKVRQWLGDPKVTATRTGLYGLLLGLAGNPEDADFLAKIVVSPTPPEEFRLGIDGVMAGYLLLAKSEGLKVLTATKLADTKAPFSETFAAMQALRFMWSSGGGKIPADELRGAMRVLLSRPQLADLVVIDLARWEDWSVMPTLMELYDKPDYNIPSIKRAIARFMLIAIKPVGDETPAVAGPHVAQARDYLSQLRQKDPKTVAAAERYSFD